MIELKSVKSSKIVAVGYADFTLFILFPPSNKSPHGSLYAYDNVDEAQHEELISAESIGKHFGAHFQYNTDHPYTLVHMEAGQPGITLNGEQFPVEDPAQAADLAIFEQPSELEQQPIPEATEDLASFAEQARESIKALTKSGILRGIVVIATSEEYEIVGREALRLATIRKTVEDKLTPGVQAKHTIWKAAVAERAAATDPLAQAVKMLNDGQDEYRRQERARAAKAQAEADAIARRLAQEDADRRAKEEAARKAAIASAQGNQEQAELILANPEPVAPIVRHMAPAIVANIPKVQGQSTRTEWRGRITNPAAVPLSHEFYTLDQSKVDGYAKRLGVHAKVEGIHFEEIDITSRRTKVG